jgi:hypothetical protein
MVKVSQDRSRFGTGMTLCGLESMRFGEKAESLHIGSLETKAIDVM